MLQRNNFKLEKKRVESHNRYNQKTNNDPGKKDPQPIYNHILLGHRESLEIFSYSLTKRKKMPKRPIYLQPSDNLYRRTRRDIEFLCNYWDRLLAPSQSYDIRLPELLRANHLMRHLSSLSLPSNQGLRVNLSFTIFDDGNRLEPEETYQL